ncbi:GNAT family N-acetyltransferase [Paenibacillus sp. JJ-223]|uniref:GNAT family N-acetyltransferase n=1 Tax=Paenibacillus sp. JJ-223 TaxID=2905647 RepID=UPI001F46513B|nr:GNAT family N-acetyltransferase [Paenibacillus sp. JJ-223]CAH1208336.1 hypothetical protein PAECIP111890_03083 [Paenibacillus sp. JJ-223]
MKFVKYAASHFDDYYALVSNMEVMKQITECTTPEPEARTQFAQMLDYNAGHIGGYYRVMDTAGVAVGYAKLIPDATDPARAELGYMILPEHWGKGYGTKIAARLIEQAALEYRQIGVLYAIIDPSNAASRRILTKQQFASVWVGDYEGLPGEILELDLTRQR